MLIEHIFFLSLNSTPETQRREQQIEPFLEFVVKLQYEYHWRLPLPPPNCQTFRTNGRNRQKKAQKELLSRYYDYRQITSLRGQILKNMWLCWSTPGGTQNVCFLRPLKIKHASDDSNRGRNSDGVSCHCTPCFGSSEDDQSIENMLRSTDFAVSSEIRESSLFTATSSFLLAYIRLPNHSPQITPVLPECIWSFPPPPANRSHLLKPFLKKKSVQIPRIRSRITKVE